MRTNRNLKIIRARAMAGDRARLVSPHECGKRWIEALNAGDFFEQAIVFNHGIERWAAGRGCPSIGKIYVEGFAASVGLLEITNEFDQHRK